MSCHVILSLSVCVCLSLSRAPSERRVRVLEGRAVPRVPAVERGGEALHLRPEVSQEHVERVTPHRRLKTAALFVFHVLHRTRGGR